jgi:hypothetical protein
MNLVCWPTSRHRGCEGRHDRDRKPTGMCTPRLLAVTLRLRAQFAVARTSTRTRLPPRTPDRPVSSAPAATDGRPIAPRGPASSFFECSTTEWTIVVIRMPSCPTRTLERFPRNMWIAGLVLVLGIGSASARSRQPPLVPGAIPRTAGAYSRQPLPAGRAAISSARTGQAHDPRVRSARCDSSRVRVVYSDGRTSNWRVDAKQGESCIDVRISPDRRRVGWIKIATEVVTDETAGTRTAYTRNSLVIDGRELTRNGEPIWGVYLSPGWRFSSDGTRVLFCAGPRHGGCVFTLYDLATKTVLTQCDAIGRPTCLDWEALFEADAPNVDASRLSEARP